MDDLRKIDADVIRVEKILAEGVMPLVRRQALGLILKDLKDAQKKLTAKAHREAAE